MAQTMAAEGAAQAIADTAERPTMTVEDYMALSGLSRSTVYRALNDGDIKAAKVRRTWVINRAAAMRQLGLA